PPHAPPFPYTTLFRSPELGGELELGREDAALLVVRRVVPEEVEPDLADGNGVGRDDRAGILPVRRLVGMDAGRDVDACFALGDLDRKSTRLNSSHVAI